MSPGGLCARAHTITYPRIDDTSRQLRDYASSAPSNVFLFILRRTIRLNGCCLLILCSFNGYRTFLCLLWRMLRRKSVILMLSFVYCRHFRCPDVINILHNRKVFLECPLMSLFTCCKNEGNNRHVFVAYALESNWKN